MTRARRYCSEKNRKGWDLVHPRISLIIRSLSDDLLPHDNQGSRETSALGGVGLHSSFLFLSFLSDDYGQHFLRGEGCLPV